MSIVTTISERAESALKASGIFYYFGYGDAYHFQGLPGESSVDIDAPFTLGEYHFIVKDKRLMLTDELKRTGTLTDEDIDKLRILQRGLAIFMAGLAQVAQHPQDMHMRESVVARGRLLSRTIEDVCEMLEGKESEDAQ